MYIRQRLSVMFLTILIIPIIFVGMLCFTNAKDALIASHTAKLEAIADLKVDKIETFFKEVKIDTAIAQQYYTVKTYLPALIKYCNERTSPEYVKAKEILDERVRDNKGGNGRKRR